MIEGFYSISFSGRSGSGTGVIALFKGVIAGADAGGVTYDGYYKLQIDIVEIAMTLNVPPGSWLVQGIPSQSKPYSFKVEANIQLDKWSLEQPMLIHTVFGPVNIIFRKIRNFPRIDN